MILLGAALFVGCEERVVSPADVAVIELAPGVLSIPVGRSSRFEANLFDAQGNLLSGRSVQWSLEDGGVAALADDGTVIGTGVGQTRVVASAEGRQGTAVLRVTSNTVAAVEVAPADAMVEFGASREFTVVVRATDGTTLTDREPTWATGSEAVATVSGDGMLTGVGLGATTVVADVDGVSGEAHVAVVAPTLESLRVEPATLSVQVGQQQRVRAVGVKPDGSEVVGLPVAWRSVNPDVGTVDEDGLVTATGEGETRIEAGFGGVVGSAVLTATPVPAASIDVEPDAPTLLVRDTLRLSATVRGADGAVLDRAPAWSSSAAGTATVDDGGLVMGVDPGSAWIVAHLDGVRDSARVTVELRPVARVVVQPSEPTLRVGETVQLTARVLADDGTVYNRDVAWSSADPDVATVDATGVVTAGRAGSATIRARVDGVTGTAVVHVDPPPIVSLDVRPSSLELAPGETASLSAVGITAGGAEVSPGAVSWSSGNDAVASVSGTGGATVTAVAQGTTQITATAQGVSGSATVEVGPPPIVSLRVEPSSLQLRSGQQRTLSAIGTTAGGDEVTDLDVSWRSSNILVAPVNGNGRVSAILPGTATITAEAQGVEGKATVAVSALKGASSIEILGGGFSLAVGEARTVSARLREADGDIYSGSVSWTSTQGGVATVSSNGLVRAIAPGNTYVVAYHEQLRDSVQVTVSASLTASIAPHATLPAAELAAAAQRPDRPSIDRPNASSGGSPSSGTWARIRSSGPMTTRRMRSGNR